MTHFRFFILATVILISSTYIAIKYPNIINKPATVIATIKN